MVVLSALAYLLQERFIFRPEKLAADFQFNYQAPFKEYFFDVSPGVRINGLHAAAKSSGVKSLPLERPMLGPGR